MKYTIVLMLCLAVLANAQLLQKPADKKANKGTKIRISMPKKSTDPISVPAVKKATKAVNKVTK
jgi:hypothetical protein